MKLFFQVGPELQYFIQFWTVIFEMLYTEMQDGKEQQEEQYCLQEITERKHIIYPKEERFTGKEMWLQKPQE